MALRFFLRPASAVLLAAGLLSSTATAFADSITLGSGMANTTVTYDNTQAGAPQNTGLPTTGTAVVVNPSYATPIAGTSYISYDPNTQTNGSNGGTTTYTTTFTGNFSGGFGTITLAADDYVVAYLNNTQIATTVGYSYNTIVGPVSFSTGLVNGANTLRFVVTNANATNVNGGPTNFDFKVSVATTPEPSSLALLGTGIIGVAGVVRRKMLG